MLARVGQSARRGVDAEDDGLALCQFTDNQSPTTADLKHFLLTQRLASKNALDARLYVITALFINLKEHAASIPPAIILKNFCLRTFLRLQHTCLTIAFLAGARGKTSSHAPAHFRPTHAHHAASLLLSRCRDRFQNRSWNDQSRASGRNGQRCAVYRRRQYRYPDP